MTGERLSYRFGPLERRGLLGPLRFGQVATIGGALAVGVELLDRVGGGAGVMAAIALLAGAVGLATAPVAGRTIEEWAPVGCAFAAPLGGSRRRFRSRLPTQGVGLGRRRPRLELPDSLRGVELVTVEHGGRALGALSERRGRLLTAVLACQALSFALLDPEVQERRLAHGEPCWRRRRTRRSDDCNGSSAPLRPRATSWLVGCTRPAIRRCRHAGHRWSSHTWS